MVKGRVVVYTDVYKAEHGKCPRGYGHWFFSCRDKVGKKHEFNYVGMYKKAKDNAIQFAVYNESPIVKLLS